MTLQDMNITRCIKPNNFGEVIHCSPNYFSDAYGTGYDMSAYIRLVNTEGVVNCSLVLQKSRVASLKFISIPQLELTAETLSIKVSRMIREEINVNINDEIFWADRLVVLGYINSDVQRFKIFMANRVQQIRDQTDKRQWHHVESSNNSADDASRGMESKHQEKIKMWFEGPLFLWKKERTWFKKMQHFRTDRDNNPEIKKVYKLNAVRVENEVLVRIQDPPGIRTE